MESPGQMQEEDGEITLPSPRVMSAGYKSRPGEFLVFTLSTSPRPSTTATTTTTSPISP